MPLQNVALIGANGTLGPIIMQYLLAASFTVTIITRQSSTSTYPSSVRVAHASDHMSVSSLTTALQGQDAVICCMRAGTDPSTQLRVADAALAAGVQRYIPSDFGSVDSTSPLALRLIPLYATKTIVRDHVIKLAKESGGKFSWTSLVCAHFFDWGLTSGLLHFDVKRGKAKVFDRGDVRWSASTLERVAEATVGILKKSEETRDKIVYVQSLGTTQNEVLEVLEKVQGRKYEVEHVSSEKYIDELLEKYKGDDENYQRTEDMVGVVGIIDMDCEKKDGFANELLGLKDENLEELVTKALKRE